jgi:predicted TIM-barrel fold metal-dependent hydrolase
VIDAYCHCGISKYLPVEDVLAMMEHVGIERAVLAQHLGEFDNEYLASVVRRHPELFTAVGLVDAAAPGWRDAVAALGAAGEFRGLRVPRATILDHPEVCRAAADEGLVLVLDMSGGVAECLPAIERLLEGGTSGIVLSHLGYPYLLDGSRPPDPERVLELAGAHGLYVMLSGHSMWFEPPYAELDAVTRETVAAFSPHAVVWGSNFPVSGDAGRVAADLELLAGGRYGVARETLAENADRLWFGAAAGSIRPPTHDRPGVSR